MSEDTKTTVEERLSVFSDEADFDDWSEIFIGGAIAAFSIWALFNPNSSIVNAAVWTWIAAAFTTLGSILAAHGLKDMMVKEIRESIVRLELSSRQGSVDFGLIRDVLLHPDQYKKFLLEAYEEAFADGVLSEEELEELKGLQEALQLTDAEAGTIAARAAINAALKDGVVSEDELTLIVKTATSAGLDEMQVSAITKALSDGKLDSAEKELLDSILGKI